MFFTVAYKHRFTSWGDLWAYRIYINPFRKHYLLCMCIYIYQIFLSHLTSKYIHTASTSYTNASIRMPVTLFLLQSCHVSVVFISTWAIWSPFWLGTKSEYPVSLAHRCLNSYDTYERTFASVQSWLLCFYSPGISMFKIGYWRWSITRHKEKLDCISGTMHFTEYWKLFYRSLNLKTRSV